MKPLQVVILVVLIFLPGAARSQAVGSCAPGARPPIFRAGNQPFAELGASGSGEDISFGPDVLAIDLSIAADEPNALYTSPRFLAREHRGICNGEWQNLAFDGKPVDSAANGDFEASIYGNADKQPYTWWYQGETLTDGTTVDSLRQDVDGDGDHELALSGTPMNGLSVFYEFEIDPGDIFDLRFTVDPEGLADGEELQLQFRQKGLGGTLAELWDPTLVDADDTTDSETNRRLWPVISFSNHDPPQVIEVSLLMADCEDHGGPGWDGRTTDDGTMVYVPHPSADEAQCIEDLAYGSLGWKIKQPADSGGVVAIDDVQLVRRDQIGVTLNVYDPTGPEDMLLGSYAARRGAGEATELVLSPTVYPDLEFEFVVELDSPVSQGTDSTGALDRYSPLLHDVRLSSRQCVTIDTGPAGELPPERSRVGITGGFPYDGVNFLASGHVSTLCREDDDLASPDVSCWELFGDAGFGWWRYTLQGADIGLADADGDEVFETVTIAEDAELTDRFAQADAAGLRPMPILYDDNLFRASSNDTSSGWSFAVDVDGDGDADAEDSFQAYGLFGRVVATEFDVGAIELWNEPNLSKFWDRSDEEFVRMANAASAAIKSTGFDGDVVLGGFAGGSSDDIDLDYIDGILSGGTSSGERIELRDLDMIGFHFYDRVRDVQGNPAVEGMRRRVTDLRETIDSNNEDPTLVDTPELAMTESAYSTYVWDSTSMDPADFHRGVEEAQQAKLAARWTLTMLSLPIERFFWYRSHDRDPDPFVEKMNYGLLRPHESEDNRWVPKESFRVFSRLLPLVGASQPRPILSKVVENANPRESVEVHVLETEDGACFLALWFYDTRRLNEPAWTYRAEGDWLDSGMAEKRHFRIRVSGLPGSLTAGEVHYLDGSAPEPVNVTVVPVAGGSAIEIDTPAVGDLPILIQLSRAN